MQIGDKVKIVKSPYHHVKNGTVSTVKNIKYSMYGNHVTIYVLDNLPYTTYREWELVKINDKE